MGSISIVGVRPVCRCGCLERQKWHQGWRSWSSRVRKLHIQRTFTTACCTRWQDFIACPCVTKHFFKPNLHVKRYWWNQSSYVARTLLPPLARSSAQGPVQTEESLVSNSMVLRGALEGAMLEVLAAQGVECNPSTQLVGWGILPLRNLCYLRIRRWDDASLSVPSVFFYIWDNGYVLPLFKVPVGKCGRVDNMSSLGQAASELRKRLQKKKLFENYIGGLKCPIGVRVWGGGNKSPDLPCSEFHVYIFYFLPV